MMMVRRGFSLIEILVVLAIMAALASIAAPLAEMARRRDQEAELRRSLREIRSALDAHKRLVDEGRIAARPGASGYPPTLEVLAVGVEDQRSAQRTKLYLLRKLPRDPLAAAGLAAAPAVATWGLRSYISPPDRPEAGEDVFDVYSKAEGSGLNGVPYKDW